MKIDLLINSLGGGGAERVMATLANGFSHKHNVSLITFNKGKDFELNKDIKKVNLHKGIFKNHTLRSILNLLNYYKKHNSRPDILISFMPANNIIAIIVSRIIGIKVIVSEHTNHTAKFGKKTEWIQKIFYRYADLLTVLTPFDVDYYKKLGANVVVMQNPLNLPTSIKPLVERPKNILIVGALNRYESKGFDSLLHLIAPVLNKHSEWTLTIAGGGDKGISILKKISKELNIQQQIIFPGFCNDIQELMQNSHIFVLPSKFEGLPMGLMEALSNGMACTAYDCISGPRDLINNNVNGLLIENQNSSKMQSSIYKLIDNFELRNQLASKAPYSMKSYGLKKIINKWEKLILAIINENNVKY